MIENTVVSARIDAVTKAEASAILATTLPAYRHPPPTKR